MRDVLNFNGGWEFSKDNKDFKPVTLPHTWNGVDGQDGGNDYYRGKCCYKKSFAKSDLPSGDEFYLEFEGVNSTAEVIFNGKSLITHNGGYSTFRVKLDNILDENTLVVTADNSANDTVYPQQADFTFYGGIYRDVNIIAVGKKHFDLIAEKSVSLSNFNRVYKYFDVNELKVTPSVDGSVDFSVNGNGDIEFKILDGDSVVASSRAQSATATLTVEKPHLWNARLDPYLYTATATLYDGDEAVDEVSCKFAFREYKIDPEKGFILNGKPYPLRGVSRHQDRPGIGNALEYKHHKEDVDLICEMVANTVRLAHYQHNRAFYDLCDERGLVVWAEIPYISRHMPNGVENTLSQMSELVSQNYNHPSIVVWGLSNEITMGGAADKSLIENHHMLNDLCHALDKTRPTTQAVVTMCDKSEEYVHIPDVLSYNHYFGWYGGSVDMYGRWFDDFHKKYPNKAIGISEYGCEALNWHSAKPVQGDYTEEYQAYYHEELIKQIAARPYLWATHVWNMFDFAADARNEGGENGMNHKGLVTFDRKYKKDSFYAYKAWLSDEPFVHICSKRFVDHAEDTVKITVYTNQPSVELFANGESLGVQKKGEFPFFYFSVKNSGVTKLKAVAGDCTDESEIRKVEKDNPDYVMQEEGAVINWFEIDMPDGMLSINNTIGDILKTFKGKLVLLSVAKMLMSGSKGGDKSIVGMNFSMKMINKSLIEMGKGFTLRRIFGMIGAKLTKEQILQINKKLNKIKIKP